jgi:hypothetical protein
MALQNTEKMKYKIYDQMFEDLTIEEEPFTYFKINPYYENNQWFVEVSYASKSKLYSVTKGKGGYMNFKLIDFKVFG